MRRFDVLVVGGGPAGSTAAYWLAKKGFEVLVLDREGFPRDKLCGGGLTAKPSTNYISNCQTNSCRRGSIRHAAIIETGK